MTDNVFSGTLNPTQSTRRTSKNGVTVTVIKLAMA